MSERKNKMKPPRRSSQISDSSSSSESTSSFTSEDEETDVRDLKPIKDYLTVRRELASQLFKSVKLEKIRMMLPQALKKMNLYDLEEWCGSELSGMSRKRILSIINGQGLAESSETDETDDSGPSLEIISDTEEWLTDDEVTIKKENSSSAKSKKSADKVKTKPRPLSKDKTKLKSKSINSGKDKSANVNIKVEGEKAEPKEGESLLDLLELEMRARAIRALIRKEEDIIPNKPTASTSSEKNTNPPASKYAVQEMQQISVTLKQGSGLDDDVMLVIQPAPTIELLSSESENEKDKKDESKRVNQRLENERGSEKKVEVKHDNQRLASKHGENEKEEQSKRVNKRLENERGTETTHSTSTIGDELAEIPDNDAIKTEDKSPLYSERNETESVDEKIDKFQKSPEKVKDQETEKALKKSSNKTTDKITDKIPDKISNKSTENPSEIAAHKQANEKEENKIQNKQPEKTSEEPEKDTDKLESTAQEPEKESETTDEHPAQPKSPVKELEEGELTSDNDSKKEAETIDVNIKKLSFKKRAKRRRHIRSKVHEGPDEYEDLDQSETDESESEVSEKSENLSKEKALGLKKKKKKIRGNSGAKGISFNKPVNESMNEKDFTPESSLKEEVKMQNEVEGQKENQAKQEELKKMQEDVDKMDMGEIIDLDDYPDDMNDLENNEQNRSKDTKKSAVSNKTAPESSTENAEPAETWASRYYNTDDVQNVIKESKIQSEIRKRFRERQRMSKLNNSPSINTTGNNSPVDIKNEEAKQKPLGSVEEYLALKAASAETINSSVNEKTQVLPDKSEKLHRKSDSARKSKSHTSKKRLKSDKKSVKDNVTATSVKPKDATNESRPD